MSPARIITASRPSLSRVECVFIAELAGEAERYEDVITQIKTIAEKIDGRLTIEERNLISVAYKNRTNTLRSSWRTVDTLEKIESTRPSKVKQAALIRRQRERIEKELTNVCKDIVRLLDKTLLPSANQGEETVFYSKMKGDYYRYLSEFAQKRDRDRYAEASLTAYKFAYTHAMDTLQAMHPTRLGLALNFAVFFHDVRKSPERACHLAKSAFDDAIMCLDVEEVAPPSLRDSVMILQLLRDDLIQWSTEMISEV